MGQYYTAVVNKKGFKEIRYYGLQVNGEAYIGVKLMEHAYVDNAFCKALCKKLVCSPHRVSWVGDYAEPPYHSKNSTATVFPFDVEDKEAIAYSKIKAAKTFNLSDYKYIVNHDAEEYIDIAETLKNSSYTLHCLGDENIEVTINPVPLLTACGNRLGGGDYYGINKGLVGRWAWDLIEIVNVLPRKKEYKKLEVAFRNER